MTSAEFGKRLDQLMEIIVSGLIYYAAWINLRLHDADKATWTFEEQKEAVERFGRFLNTVASALNGMALMQFAKAFDRNPRTASLTILLDAAQQTPSLVPGRTAADLAAVSNQIKQSEQIIEKLTRLRNQNLAHADANPKPVAGMIKRDFDTLIEHTKSTFNCLSIGHRGASIAWDYPVENVERHASEVMGILVEKVRNDRQ